MTNVMRLAVGSHVFVFDGVGNEFECQIIETKKKAVTLAKVSQLKKNFELPFKLHFGLPLPKSDRQRFLVEKLTELGVTDLTVLDTRYSVVKANSGNIEKLHRYVIESSKQCGRNVLLNIHPTCTLTEFLAPFQAPHSGENSLRLIADPRSRIPVPLRRTHNVTAIFGPEGGFTEQEIDLAVNSGFQSVSLGARILRIETAAIAVASFYSMGN
jgi:16S rRNA (uracil1498-N3)-methyltransferase